MPGGGTTMRHSDVIEPTATVADGVLYLAEFEERDPEVVNFVDASDDAESAVHRAMQVGARALGLAQTSIDANLVEQAFDGMTRSFDGTLGETIEQIGKVADNLLDEETGELPRALKQFQEQLDELLGDAFDQDSKKSVLAKLDRLMDEAAKRQVAAVKRVVDPDDPESPLGRHRQEFVKAVKEVGDSVSKAVAEVSEKIAVTK